MQESPTATSIRSDDGESLHKEILPGTKRCMIADWGNECAGEPNGYCYEGTHLIFFSLYLQNKIRKCTQKKLMLIDCC